MARTIDQQIATTQAKLARLRIRQRASQTRQKNHCRRDCHQRRFELAEIRNLAGRHPAQERHP